MGRSTVGRAALLVLLAVAAVTGGALAASLGPSLAAPAPAALSEPAVPAPARVTPAAVAAGACAENALPKLIRVSIRAQRAWFCDRGRTVLAVAATTGAVARRGRATPTGSFRIEGRQRNAILRPDDGGRYQVRYWVPFSGTEYGFHDAPWQRFALGSAKYRWQGSHGCVHLSVRAMRFLYRWGTTGTPVRITR